MVLVCKWSNSMVWHPFHFLEKLWNVWLLSSVFPYNLHSWSLTFSRNKSYDAEPQGKVCISRLRISGWLGTCFHAVVGFSASRMAIVVEDETPLFVHNSCYLRMKAQFILCHVQSLSERDNAQAGLFSTALYLQPSILCKWLDRDHNGSNSTEVGIWSALAPFGWAATPTAFIRWVHTLINPHWCKKTNKVTLNGKGLVGTAKGNGAESALAKASKPFSYWQMKSVALQDLWFSSVPPHSFSLSCTPSPIFFPTLSLRSYRLHAAGKKWDSLFSPLYQHAVGKWPNV